MVYSYGAVLGKVISRFYNASRIKYYEQWLELHSNTDLHRELGVETLQEIVYKFAASHDKRLQIHVNEEAMALTNIHHNTRRLKRIKPLDLVPTT